MAQQSLPAPVDTYQFGHMGTADLGAIQGIQGLAQQPNYAQQLYQQYSPALSSMSQQTSYAPQQTVDYGNQIAGSVQNLPGFAQQSLETGYDPQNALYGRTLQQLQDQTRAAQEARGIASSPYGAGVENKALSDFNIDWQNTQLQRQGTAAQTASGLLGTYAQNTGAGASLAQGVPMQQLQAATGLSSLGQQSYALPQQVLSDYLAYLGGGTSADTTAVKNYSAEADAANTYNKNLFSTMPGLGAGANWLYGKVV